MQRRRAQQRSAGILPAVPRASRPRGYEGGMPRRCKGGCLCGVRVGRRSGVRAGRPHDSRRDGGATKSRILVLVLWCEGGTALRCEGGTPLRCEGGTPSRQPPGRRRYKLQGPLFPSSLVVPTKVDWRTGYAPPARRRTGDRDSYLYLNHGVTTNPGRRHGSAADFGLGCPQVHPTICNVEMSQNISGQSCRLAPICMGLGLDRRS